jgi:hypothetical protein
MWWTFLFSVLLAVVLWQVFSYLGRWELKKALGLQKIPTFETYEEIAKYHELIKERAERERKEARNIQRIIQDTDDPNTVEKLFAELNSHNKQADYFDRVRGCVVEFRKLPCY